MEITHGPDSPQSAVVSDVEILCALIRINHPATARMISRKLGRPVTPAQMEALLGAGLVDHAKVGAYSSDAYKPALTGYQVIISRQATPGAQRKWAPVSMVAGMQGWHVATLYRLVERGAIPYTTVEGLLLIPVATVKRKPRAGHMARIGHRKGVR